MRKLVFLTGTRADYGKLKPLMRACCRLCDFEVHIYATGMHVLQEYGYTVTEIFKDRFSNIFVGKNQSIGEWMDVVLANTIVGFGQYIAVLQPDFIIVHGDRVEAFAGAIVGSFRNIPVIHIEGEKSPVRLMNPSVIRYLS